MIRQSKTTIKELSAQYRAVLRHAFLAGVIALSTSVATANTDVTTDVTFAGDYVTSTGTKNVSEGTPNAYNFNYQGTEQNGDLTQNIQSNTTNGVDANNFAYTLANGDMETLAANTTYEASDYTGATVAGTDDGNGNDYSVVVVSDDYTLNAGTAVVDSAYSYENPQYDANDPESQQYITLDSNGSARGLTANYETNANYTSGSTEITNTTTATDLVSLYSYQVEGGHHYVLSDDGTGVRDIDNDGQAVDLNNSAIAPELRDALQGMLDAYAADSGSALVDAVSALDDMQTQENDNYAAALSAYNVDVATQQTLSDNYATYTAALTAYENATNAESEYQQALDNFDADTEKFNAASDVYNSSIEETIDTRATAIATDAADAAEQNAKNYADATVATETTARESADQELQDAIEAEIERAQGAEGTIRGEFASADEQTLAGAKEYTDDKVAAEESARESADRDLQDAIEAEAGRATAAENALRNEFASANAETLARANAYTDKKVDTLEKNVSGGVAAATALSAVSVSNVKRGEVSVGGGYGYYNDQSAVALGATMGLSDNWSVNAGAGVATGDKTQFAIRAGTNYKFKLF